MVLFLFLLVFLLFFEHFVLPFYSPPLFTHDLEMTLTPFIHSSLTFQLTLHHAFAVFILRTAFYALLLAFVPSALLCAPLFSLRLLEAVLLLPYSLTDVEVWDALPKLFLSSLTLVYLTFRLVLLSSTWARLHLFSFIL